MIEPWLRPTVQRIVVDPIAQLLLKRSRLSPGMVTLMALLSGIGCAICLIVNNSLLAVLLLILSGYCDMLDGTIARLQNTNTASGAVLDIITDRAVEFFILFGLFCVAPYSRGVAVIWMLGSSLLCVTSFLVVAIFTENNGQKGFYYSPGLMERAEAFFFFFLMIVMPNWFNYLAWVYVFLVSLTAIVRIYQFRAAFKIF